MALSNPIEIKYGDRTLGGSSGTYLLHDPYVIDVSHDAVRIAATVVVKGSGLTSLQAACEELESDLTKRDKDFSISLNGAKQEWAFGDTVLNSTATCSKSGDPELDRGVSRAYAIEIVGALPSTDTDGLRSIATQVDYADSRQKTVTLSGVYTAFDGSTASEQYESEIDAKSSEKLEAVDSTATFELVSEQTQVGRNDHELQFTRQYVELLENQTQAALNDPAIVNHSVRFTTSEEYPGDGAEDVYRLQRASASYQCVVDIEQTTDLQDAYKNKALPHLKALFQQNYESQEFAIEAESADFNETAKSISANVRFVFVPGDGERIAEVQQSVSYEETRNIRMTHVHSGREYDAYVDPGWSVRDRVWTRNVAVYGNDVPRRRIGDTDLGGDAGPIPRLAGIPGVDLRNDGTVRQSGWNVIQNRSEASKQYIGKPDGDVIELTILRETVRERYNTTPEGSTGTSGTTTPGGGTPNPITPGGN